MNFLAHCLLAQPGDGFLAGAVLGDFVKGPIPSALPLELRAGIRLHRRIDSHSNRLAAMRASLGRFPPALRRPAPALLDIVADHCLALAWPRFATGSVEAFSAAVYRALARFTDAVPAAGQRFVDYMVTTDLLARYHDPLVAERAMAHVLRRLGFEQQASALEVVLGPALPGLQADFLTYFPLLAAFAETERPRALAFAADGCDAPPAGA